MQRQALFAIAPEVRNHKTGHRPRGAAILALLSWLLPASVAGAADPPLPQAARAWVDDMRTTCANFENGRLTIDWRRFMTRADVTGEGKPDLILHATPDAVRCNSMLSMNCGTAGCGLMVVVNDDKPHEFIAKSWDVGKAGDGRGLLIVGVHWSSCDYRPECRSILAWSARKRRFEEIGLMWRHVAEEE